MPTKTKKKATRTTTVKKKVAPKTAKAKKAAPVEKPGGFMWKLLEQKEAARKQREAQAKAGNGGFERIHANGGDVYARFNGPRRKAA